jgi:hypothetical protein
VHPGFIKKNASSNELLKDDDEIWYDNLAQLEEYIILHKKRPNKKSENINEKKLGVEIERLGPRSEFIHKNRSLNSNREFYNYNWSEIQLRITNYLKQNTEI